MKLAEIVKTLDTNKNSVIEACKNIEENDFFAKKGEKWSVAGHIEHLYNSIAPLNKAFLLPKFILPFITGKPNRPSRSYNELVKKYNEKLEQNKESDLIKNNRFGPKKNKKYNKKKLISKFEGEYQKLTKNLEKKWDDDSLEKYLIPHPLLGKLTIREMMMFTAYHTLHHYNLLSK